MPQTPTFTFADLFSGIGGFTYAAIRCGGEPLLACEIDPIARDIYAANYGLVPHPDIRTLQPLPAGRLDLVMGGFPCQSHSTLGKRRGLREGRGQLFHDLERFVMASRPKAFLFENVKGILSSTNLPRLLKPLADAGYAISYATLNSKNFGLPQNRERVFIVGVADAHAPFDFSRLLAHKPRGGALRPMSEFLDSPAALDPDTLESLKTDIFDGMPLWEPPKATATGFLLRAQRSNFTNRKLFSTHGIIGTIPTGSPPPIYDEARGIARHLSATELLRAQGFPVGLKRPPSAQSRIGLLPYVGNAVSPPVIQAIIREMQRQGVVPK